jgi:hypothetical protein
MNNEKEHQTRFDDSGTGVAEKEEASTHYANSEAGLAHVEGNRKEEKRILRRLDSVLLPLTALLYLSVSCVLWIVNVCMLMLLHRLTLIEAISAMLVYKGSRKPSSATAARNTTLFLVHSTSHSTSLSIHP